MSRIAALFLILSAAVLFSQTKTAEKPVSPMETFRVTPSGETAVSADSSGAETDSVSENSDTISVFTRDSIKTADSLAADSVRADTARDSAEVEARRLTLLEKLKEQSRYLYTHPKTADTLFNPYRINRISYSRDDYFTWNEVLRGQGEFIPTYYSPRHHLNRSLWRGYTVPLANQNNGIITAGATNELAFPSYEPIQVENLNLTASGELTPTLFPHTRVSPQLFLLMENGLFNGNTLELRIMRNITRNISLGLFSSYRNLDRYNYTHPGTYGMYRGISALDTADLSNAGRNPLSANHSTTLHGQWKKRNTYNIMYRYQGLSNDMIYPYPHKDMPDEDSDYDTVWYNRDNFNSTFRASGEIPLAQKFRLDFDGAVINSVHRENPVTTTILSKSEARRGDQEYQGAGGKIHFAPILNDTISFSGSVNRSETQHTNGVRTTIHETDLILENGYYGVSEDLELRASAGSKIVKCGDEIENHPYTSLSARWVPGKLALEGWGKMDIVPLAVSFDSSQIPTPGFAGDRFWGSGIRATLSGNHLALTTGYSFVTGVEERTINAYWQNQMSPYSNPGHVLTLTPSFGEWHGISVSSSWNIADKKPYVKSTSRIDFRINKEGRTRHFYTSFYVNYWSARDQFSYAGRDNWHRPIYDIGTKLTAEIKSFRLFMKMDNLLNRNNTYVPGYYMPGLIVRWGFAWTITG